MRTFVPLGFVAVAALAAAIARGGDVLWDSTASIKRPAPWDPKDRATWVSVTYTNIEAVDEPEATNYVLSGIVVPPGG